ncbi:MAG: malto-oligosyltrehalose trehalohydrolase [Nibricoccus sp.]
MSSQQLQSSRCAVGAQVAPDGVTYRVWAPEEPEMSVVVTARGAIRSLALEREEGGYWSVFDPEGRAGDLYQYKLSSGRLLPDVVSRFQPQGVHGPSECIDPAVYPWRATNWVRPRWSGQATYELHIGTFTPEGTYAAAIERLEAVRDLGVEAIEVMPVGDFGGDRNWGYDGVSLYAPARCYGRPDDLRALTDAAHGLGLAVILDVVYNHMGPSGNYLSFYSQYYMLEDQTNPWGQSFNLQGENSQPVRDFLLGNALYWLDEYRVDGLRLDATHAITDNSTPHFLSVLAEAVHARGGFLIAEDERNDATLITSRGEGGLGMDAVWADDFHHQVRVALTDIQESYFAAYGGRPEDLASTLAHGWTYRGQPYSPWKGRDRGSFCSHLPASSFVYCIENHDQIGNRPTGDRISQLVPPAQYRAASMLLCLSPYAPLLFMGQEWASTAPFLFFTNHGGELGRMISIGRCREFERLGQHWNPDVIPDPEEEQTFERSKLNWSERESGSHASVFELYRECFRQRKSALTEKTRERANWHVQLWNTAIGIRYKSEDRHWLLLVAFQPVTLTRDFPAELQPPGGTEWTILLHSEAKRFGGKLNVDSGQRFEGLKGPGGVWLEARVEK